MKDTPKEPVESLEDSISLAIDGAEAIEDEITEEQPVDVEAEPAQELADADTLESEPATESPEDSEGDNEERDDEQLAGTEATEDDDTPEVDMADSEGEEALPVAELEAPQHWNAADRELFSSQPAEAQEFLLKRHKEMEGDYTRKSQDAADTKRQYDSIRDALSPYEQEFASAGLDHAGAVRKLASVHQALKTNGKEAIMNLAQTYGIDLSEPDIDDTTDPALRNIQQKMNQIESGLSRQEAVAQQSQADALLSTIQQFETAKDADGTILHPHFLDLKDDITGLFNAGLAKDLDEGYRKALALRPELVPVVKAAKVVSKVNQADRVKKAKKAATGIRSSGAVGKRNSGEISLHDEIAANWSQK
jgi:hypothetical protein